MLSYDGLTALKEELETKGYRADVFATAVPLLEVRAEEGLGALVRAGDNKVEVIFNDCGIRDALAMAAVCCSEEHAGTQFFNDVLERCYLR